MNEKTKHINGLLKDTRKILEHEAEGKAESIKENIERIFFTMGVSVALMLGENNESN